MPTIRVKRTYLYFERAGHGPSMLFVHGMCGHADVWLDQAARFADRYTCVRYDRRGHSRRRAATPPSTHRSTRTMLPPSSRRWTWRLVSLLGRVAGP